MNSNGFTQKIELVGIIALLVSLIFVGMELSANEEGTSAESRADCPVELNALPKTVQSATHTIERDRIAAIRDQSNQAIRAHDAAGIVASYDTPYQINTGAGVLYHDSPEVEQQLWEELFEQRPDVVYTRTPDSIVVSDHLPRASERGSWVGTWMEEAGPVEVSGSYSASWRKVDVEWKVQSEMFVTLHCAGDGC